MDNLDEHLPTGEEATHDDGSIGERVAEGAVDAVDAVSGVAETATSACFIVDLFDDVLGDACYVATAAHGDLDAPEVVFLRRYRDQRLLTNRLGCAFTATYYAIGPYLAAIIRHFPRLKRPARLLLAPAVWWARVSTRTPGRR